MKSPKNNRSLLFARLLSLFLIIIAFLTLLFFTVFLPRTEVSDYDELTPMPTFSVGSLLDGSYFAQLGDHFTDTVFSRDRIKVLYSHITDLFGKETVTVNDKGHTEVDIGPGLVSGDEDPASEPDFGNSAGTSGGDTTSGTTTPDVSTGTTTPDTSTGTTTPDTSTGTSSEDTSSSGGNKPEIEVEGIFILDTRAMEIYYGDSSLKRIPSFAEALNGFAASLPGVNVYSMPIPKACAFYLRDASEAKRKQEGNTLRDLKAIDERLSDGVHSVNIYDTLNAHRDEDIYFRTDHHWTSLGAYYAAQQFASDLGLPFQDLSVYEKEARPGFLGTMYKYTNMNAIIRDNPEDFVTYKPPVSYTATFYNQSFQNGFEHDIFFHFSDDYRSMWYSTFINGDAYAVQIKSGACSNGRKLLIVKDSYGNALVPFLLYSFEEIYVVDARVFKLKLRDVVSQYGVTDVLFAESLFSSVGADYISSLKGICQ